MGIFDMFYRRPFGEATAPKPKDEVPFVEPLGAPSLIDPVDKADRKDTAAMLNANMRLAEVQDRIARYADFNNMDKSDLAAMLGAVTSAALTFEDPRAQQGFKVECPDDEGAQLIIDECLTRTKLSDKIYQVTRDVLKFGDAFVEPIFQAQDMVGIQTYPVEEMYRQQNDKGQLLTGKIDGFNTAFQQRRNSKVIAGWQPWEIVHFKLEPDDRKLYSRAGLLDALRSDWRKLELVEQGMVVARVTRAYPRRVHYVDMTGKQVSEQERSLAMYIRRMTNKVFGVRPTTQPDNLPIADVGEDMYLATGWVTPPGSTSPVLRANKVETEDPAMAGLAELGDVTYLRAKLWSMVPGDIVGQRRNTTGDLDSQDLAYGRFLRRLQDQLAIGIKAILNQQLMARGRVGVKLNIVFPVVIVGAAWKHSDARFKDSLTLRNYVEMSAVSRRFMLKRSYNMSDAEVDAEFENIKAEQQSDIFLPVLPQRNGPATAADLNSPDTADGKVGNAKNKARKDSLPSADTGAAAALKALDREKAKSITGSGVHRGSNIGKRVRGNFGG